MKKRLVSFVSALALAISSLSLTAFAAEVGRTGEQVTVHRQTAKRVSESTLYAGEIFLDGESKVKYLYSDDITATSTVLGAAKSCLAQAEHSGFSELLTESDLVDGAKGYARCSDPLVTMDEVTNWKSSRSAAYKLYPTATVTHNEWWNLYDGDDAFAEACRTAREAYTEYIDGNGEEIAVGGPLGVLSSTSTDTVTHTVIDGNLVNLIDRDLDYNVEEITVLYTKVELTSKAPKLPFELSKPTSASISANNEKNAFDSCEVRYSQNDSMSAWMTRDGDPDQHDAVVKEYNDMGYDGVWINAQIDWSLDSTDDWKCNAGNAELWLTDGNDDNNIQRLGDWAYTSTLHYGTTANYSTIFQGSPQTNDPDNLYWNGRHEDGDGFDGWKDILKKGQYTIKDNGEGEKYAVVDLTKHTLYTRVRYRVTVRPLEGQDMYVVSEWSDIAAVGKDAAKLEPIKPEELDPPQISDLHYTDKEFNDYPVVAYKLAVSDKLKEQLARVSGANGSIWLEIEARVKGKKDWVGLQGDWIVTAGDMELDLQNIVEKEEKIPKGTAIELRARYRCSQANVENDFYTDWSTISFASQGEERVKGSNRYATAATISEKAFEKSDWVVIANGDKYFDALAGGPLAVAYNAPILLTKVDSLPAETLAEIKRLEAKHAIILGGSGAVGPVVRDALTANGLDLKIVKGQNKFGTSVEIAKATKEKTEKDPAEIFFVSADKFADALSIGPVAASKGCPMIYLPKTGAIPDVVTAYLSSMKGKVTNAYVIGGTGVISDDAMKAAGDLLGLELDKTIERVRKQGGNKYDTCLEINKKFADVLTGNTVCVATGEDFPDALAGGVFAALKKAPLFLVNGKDTTFTLSEAQIEFLKGKAADEVFAFGGSKAVPDAYIEKIAEASGHGKG